MLAWVDKKHEILDDSARLALIENIVGGFMLSLKGASAITRNMSSSLSILNVTIRFRLRTWPRGVQPYVIVV